MRRARFLLSSFVVCALALMFGSCLPGGTTTDARKEGYQQFLKVVASAGKDGYTPYWLGRSFDAGGLSFTGPDVGSGASAVKGGGIDMSYLAEVFPQQYTPSATSTSYVGLELVMYSRAAWEVVKDRFAQDPPRSSRKRVTIQGEPAELWTIAAGTRPVNTIRLLVELSGTHVLVAASAGGLSRPGGPDLNPLTDEQTFLSVMQQLRPYPQ